MYIAGQVEPEKMELLFRITQSVLGRCDGDIHGFCVNIKNETKILQTWNNGTLQVGSLRCK